ncbi:MAG: M60 family metallopeptidase [Bacteroidales bacterium]|nr:M60 family metallopeptidase [Bacteroidales bacterium]
MKYISKIAGLLALTLLAFSCVDENNEALAPNTFEISTDYNTIALEQFKQVAFIPVKSNINESEWQLSSTADWCQVGRSVSSEKGIMIAVDDNTDREKERTATVTAKAGGKEYKIKVIQTGYGPAIIVSDVNVGPEGGVVQLSVISNVEIDDASVKSPSFNPEDNGDDGEPWISYLENSQTKAFATKVYTFNVETNELPDKRVATVSLKAKNAEDASASTTCKIVQNSISVTSTEVFSDQKINVLSVKANQVSSYEGPAENLVDGSYFTHYHSPYEVETVFPVVWEFEFYGDTRLDYINIMHRASGSTAGAHPRGQIGEFNVYYKINPTDEYTLAQKFDFGGRGGYQTANLDTPIENPTWIKIEILNGDPNGGPDSGDKLTYITCGEVEFFNSNRADVNGWIEKIFTDLSCSELREGVTKKEIVKMNAVSPYLATNVAMPLFNGTYNENEQDFRIHSYEPYSDNRVNKALVMQLYSAMDNPTGIEVKSGQDIIVCVDQIPDGQTVSLAVYSEEDEYGPNYGGGGSNENVNQNTVLQAGVNTIRINADGMAYVMNTVPVENREPLSSFKSVKVHILPGCGTIQGYFDPARHTDERYKEILNRCTYKYFMVKGKKCLFLFHTNQLRSDFPNSIRGGINAWDNLVSWEHELMGLDKVEWFNNHMMAVTSTNPDVYMNATNRRVQFNASTINWICDPDRLAIDSEGEGVTAIWGPAHEMGHINQMAINWRSTTESSNNLFSNYANYKYSGDAFYKTRWSRGDKLEKLAKDYANKTPWAILGDGSYQGEDPGLHMRMNWQLWNYYHNCGFMPDFFPQLFAYFRDGHQLPNQDGPTYGRAENAGLSQLEYYEACCVVSGEDLTDFFDTWGFFRTIDQTYEQYGKTKYTVTDVMINASKARVRDMGLPKAAPIQYLEDRATFGNTTYSQMGYYTQFKDKVKISKTPKATISGRSVKLTDCDQAVAVEVRRGTESTGELLFFSNMFNFDVPSSVSLSGNSLWAVQSDGQRIKVQ